MNQIPEVVAGGTTARPTQVTPALLRQWPLPDPQGSKYSRGEVLVVGGARRTPGAAMLTGTAALRMGAGRLSLAVAESVAAHVAVAIPESGVIGLPEDDLGSVTGRSTRELLGAEAERTSALVVGPGLDDAEGTVRLLTELLPHVADDVPVVLDAFGATVLPQMDKSLVSDLAQRLVLTPNTGELARLLEVDELGDDETLEAAISCARRYKAAVACNQWVVADGRVWEITTGDSGLGTSGSGDVSAGAITGLLARGAGIAQAVVWGKYVHAASGDALVTKYGRVGYLARDICLELPQLLKSLSGD